MKRVGAGRKFAGGSVLLIHLLVRCWVVLLIRMFGPCSSTSYRHCSSRQDNAAVARVHAGAAATRVHRTLPLESPGSVAASPHPCGRRHREFKHGRYDPQPDARQHLLRLPVRTFKAQLQSVAGAATEPSAAWYSPSTRAWTLGSIKEIGCLYNVTSQYIYL